MKYLEFLEEAEKSLIMRRLILIDNEEYFAKMMGLDGFEKDLEITESWENCVSWLRRRYFDKRLDK